MVADDRAGVVADIEIEPILNPLLLNKFKLPEQARANRHKDNAVLAVIGGVVGLVFAVRQSTAQNSTALVQCRTGRFISVDLGIQHIPGIGTSDMGRHGTLKSLNIVVIFEIYQNSFVFRQP